MTKTKIILGLTTILGILALTATAATASFTAVTPGRTSGSSHLKAGSIASFQIVAGGLPLTSSKAPDTWKIQDTKIEQNATKEGRHLDQEIDFQEVRTASGVIVIVNNPIVVQFVITGPTSLVVNLSKPVVIRLFLNETTICTVKINAEEANKRLTKANDTNVESSKALEINSEITSIHSTSEPAEFCKLAGIESANSTGTFTQTSIEHGVIIRP